MNQHKYQCGFTVQMLLNNDQSDDALDDSRLSQKHGTLQIPKSDDAVWLTDLNQSSNREFKPGGSD